MALVVGTPRKTTASFGIVVMGGSADSRRWVRSLHDATGLPAASVSLMPMGDIHALPFPDATLDRAFVHTVMEHVAEPVSALAERNRKSVEPHVRAALRPHA
ncbi:MAG: methyltransferase domain-containing protein [Chloroflexi bacterium]|nr:methyltransferase domain-containing protein [Chloroflexota bacterium]